MSSPLPADPRIHRLLVDVARAEGPVRLFKPRKEPQGPGLLPAAHGPKARLITRLLDSCLQEVPRAPRQPRLLLLSTLGIRTLVEGTPAAQRPTLVGQVSSLYRERVLRAWKELARPAELSAFQACLTEQYGDLLAGPVAATPPAGEASDFKRALAKELVLSWERTREPEARRGLSRAMLSLGLRELGQPGEHTQFTGRLHFSEDPLFQGDPVEITEPGWTVTDHQGEFLLRKAQVKAAFPHA